MKQNNLVSPPEKVPDQMGHYKIIAQIGAGGMGKVYKAHDLLIDRIVAIKVIHPNNISKKAKKRFLLEAKIMAKLRHHNIVTVNDVATDAVSNVDYIVMDFIEGESLSGKSFPIRRTLEIIRDVAQAIDYAHQQGIIHRDLKPANIILKNNGQPTIMDFGLAKNLKGENFTQTGSVIGTPRYMAPEQAQGEVKKICPQTDVYALGTILYELLASKPAIEGETPNQILFNLLHKELTPLKKHNPKIPLDLEAICYKATAKKCSDRYQNSLAFADDVNKFLNGELIAARFPAIYKRFWQKIKQHKMIVVLLLATFSLLAFGMIFLSVYNSKKDRNKIEFFLQKAHQITAKKTNTLAAYIDVENYLDKALEIAPGNKKIKHAMFKLQNKLGLLALKQKEYLLAQIATKKIKKLGYIRQAIALKKQLAKQQQLAQQKHKKFITKAMEYMLKKPGNEILQWFVFKIIKTNRNYVLEFLIPYLKSKNNWQRKLAIQALGKFGNAHTKIEDKDSVEWLMQLLEKTSSKKVEELEDIINALGRLGDSRANNMVSKIRWQAGNHSVLWKRTKIAYGLIPVKSGKLNTAQEFYSRGHKKQLKGDLSGAMFDYGQALALDPKMSGVYFHRGLIYKDQGNLVQAAIECKHAIKFATKRTSHIYHLLGDIYLQKKDLDKTMENYNKGIVANPGFVPLYLARAEIYWKKGDFASTMSDLMQALALDPNNPKIYNHRGRIYDTQGMFKKALADYQKAIALDFKNPIVFHNRGNILQKLGNLVGALSDYHHALSINPKLPETYNSCGAIYFAQGDLTKAIKNYTQAIALNPKYAGAYGNRGLIYQKLKNFKKAFADYNKSIALDANSANTYFNRGNAYQMLGNSQNAIDDFSKAISIDPKLSKSYGARGMAYLSLKKYPPAINDLQTFLKLAPNHSNAAQIRAILQKHSKK